MIASKQKNNQPTVECFIGIDPGSTTGFAAWDPRLKEFEEFKSGGFWEIYRRVLDYPRKTTVIFLEDPNLIRPTFPRKASRREMMKISQNVGMNKRDAQLLMIGFMAGGHIVHPIKPQGRKGVRRKWTAETFMNITGHHEGLNEHVRDAAMMVYGLSPAPVSRFIYANNTTEVAG